MALSAFDDKNHSPTDESLRKVLAGTADIWPALVRDLQEQFGPLTEEWKFSGKAYGWGFRLKEKKRALIYMTPCDGYLIASFALGERACAAARHAGLSPEVLQIIEDAPKYAEGRGVRVPVRSEEDAAQIKILAGIKAAN
jgi:hypothetical protein